MNFDVRDAEGKFTEALYNHGLRAPNGGWRLDGTKHHCPIDGKPNGDDTGRYQFWPYGKSGDGRPHGWYQDMSHDAEPVYWQYHSDEPITPPTPEERRAYAERKNREEREREERSAEALTAARARFESAKTAEQTHPYIVRKQIQGYCGELRQEGANLLVPYRRISLKGRPLATLQTIFPTGDKRFSQGISRPQDSAYIISGDGESRRVFIAEGVATAESAAAALRAGDGFRVVFAAGDKGRLKGVTEAARSLMPEAKIYILADDDYRSSLTDTQHRNPGQSAARAVLSSGKADGILTPPFSRNPDIADAEENSPSDWNDFAISHGIQATTAELEKQISDITHTSRETALAELHNQADTDDRPLIIEDSLEFYVAVDMAIKAVKLINDREVEAGGSPVHYVSETKNALVRVLTDRSRKAYIKDTTVSSAGYLLSRAARFAKPLRNDKGYRTVKPSGELVTAFVNIDGEAWAPLPSLRGLSYVPIVRPDGSIYASAGYDTVTGVYYDAREEVIIPEAPTRADAQKAAAAVLDVFANFPFADGEPRYWANTMGLLLSGVMRDYGFGLIPMAVIEAPRQGTGKSLLAQTVSVIITGGQTATLTAANDPEEWRKQITTALMADEAIMLFDNVSEKVTVNDVSLARLLTSEYYSDRILGTNNAVRVRNRSLLIMTGNNIRLGGDIPRRTYRIRLDDGRIRASDERVVANPERMGRQIKYIKSKRAEVLTALLTMIKAWVLAGRPEWSGKPIESFEEWSRVIGGILEFCDTPELELSDFLKRAEADREDMGDDDQAQWTIFISEIYKRYEDKPFSMRQLADRCRSEKTSFYAEVTSDQQPLSESVPDSLGAPEEKRFSRALGLAFRSRRGRPFDCAPYPLKISTAGEDSHNKAGLWRIIPAADTER